MTQPQQSQYAHHVFICIGEFCDPNGEAHLLYARLPELLGEDLVNYHDNPCRVKRGITACLGVCTGGPLMVVYPEGIWYHNLTEDKVRRIIREHLRGGKPVEEYIFHRLDQSGVEE